MTTPQAGYDTRIIFKQNTIGLNSEFSFFYIGCHTIVNELIFHYYLFIDGLRIVGFIPF